MAIRTTACRELFLSIDRRDTDAFLAFLSDDVVFRFGNAAPVQGKAAVGAMIQGFFESIAGLRHEVLEVWEEPETVICHGIVTYTRADASTLSVPFANILQYTGDTIREYLIFV